MSRLRYLNPLRIRDAARQIRRITGGGGSSSVPVPHRRGPARRAGS